MTILQSTRQTFTKSMPLIFDKKNSTWPNPEQSIGKECLSIGSLRCWLPIGPALAAFEVLSKDLKGLLDKHQDALKQGEPKPRAISFNMWMTGSKPESSSPTIVFSSKSPRQRAFAKALLKDSKLLDQYPGIRIKTWDRMPAIYQAGSQEPDTIETTRDSTDNVPNDVSEEAIYMVDNSRGSCGALIAFGRSRLATMGGILLINGTYYGISAQHGRYEYLEEPEDATNEGNSLCFDDDSDTEDYDLDNLVEITSSESISSYSDEGSSNVSFASTTSPKDRIFEYPIDFPSTTELALDHTPEVPSSSRPTYSSNPKISNLLPYERNDLDYEVFEIDEPRYHNRNKIDLPSSGHPLRHILPNKVARTLVECAVWAVTGTTGCVQGTMMRQAHYIKMEGSETFQEMWAVKLDRNTKPGDSGAWVVDSAGQLYGHIVAGDPMLGLAFIIPAYKIFDDIKRRFGSEALCCPSSSTTRPYSTLKQNVSRSGLSVGITQTWAPSRLFRWSDCQRHVPARLTLLMGSVLLSIPLYLHGAYYSIVSIRLGGAVLGTRIATMCRYMSVQKRLDFCNDHSKWPGGRLTRTIMYVACWTEQYLQTVVQEVPHRRAAFCRGNLLGTSMIMTGTSNQPMAATFNATASSTKTLSFGSMVPNIGAYTYIGYTQETTNDAAADRIDEVHKTVVWKYSLRRAQDQSSTMSVRCSSVNFNFSWLAVDDFAGTLILTCHRSVTNSNHRPNYANYTALSHLWHSVPPPDLPRTNDWASIAGFSTTNSFLRSAHQSRSSTICDQRGEPLLECPFRRVGCPHEYGFMHTAQWLAHQLSHFDTSQSTRLDTRRTCTREQAISFASMDTIAEHYEHRYHTAFGFSAFEYDYLGICLDVMENLRCEEEYRSESDPTWWYWCYWVLLFSGLSPGSFAAAPAPRGHQLQRLTIGQWEDFEYESLQSIYGTQLDNN